ncbi:MAG: hypothetical protein V1778_02865 [bacterium]
MKSKGIVLVPLIIMIGAMLAFGTMAYLVIRSYQSTTTNSSVACTLEAKICPDGSSVGRIAPSCEFAACLATNTNAVANVNISSGNTNSAANTNAVNTNRSSTTEPVGTSAHRYTSPASGISFVYADTVGGKTVKIREIADTIFVYIDGMAPEQGQYVRFFTKDSADTLKTAVEKRFLAGYSSTDCFMKSTTVRGLANGWEAAQVSHSLTTTPDDPYWWANAEKCPQGYTTANGISYFLYNPVLPTKFYYVSIGQYAIPSDTADSGWESTVQLVAATAVVPADWKTYTNTTLSFTLRYPSTWQVTEANDSVSIHGTSNLNANSSADDIAFTTPGVVIKTQQSLFPDDECLTEQTNVNAAGAQRIRQIKGCSYAGSTVATYFQRGDAYVVFSWTTDVPDQYPTYDQILSTFQFTNE